MLVTAAIVAVELGVARFALGIPLSPGLDRLFVSSLLLALISTVAARVLRPKMADVIALSLKHVEIPVYRGSWRRRRIRYRDVYSIEKLSWGPVRTLVVGVRGRLPARVPLRWLVSPADSERIETSIRERIAALPDAVEHLRELDRCHAVWQAAGRGAPWLTLGSAALLGILFLCETGVGATGSGLRLLAIGALSSELVRNGELDRLFTSGLLHSGIPHLLVNGLGLVALGVMLERLLGWSRFLLILSFAQVGGAALWVVRPGSVGATGASAAIYGAFVCWLYLQLTRRHELPAFLRAPAWFWILLLGSGLWIEINLPRLAHAAHLGGLVAGFAISAALVRGPLDRLHTRRPRWLCVAAATCMLVWGVALGAGILRAWGPIEEQAARTAARILASPPVSTNVHEEAAGALAALEWRRFQRDGPAMIGVAPVRAKEITVVLGASAPRSVVLDLTRPLAEDLTLHAVALEGDSLVGLLEVRLTPSSPDQQRWTDPALERLGPDARLELTRLDGTSDDVAPTRQPFRFWPVVREEPPPPRGDLPTPPPSGGPRSSRAPCRGRDR
jgi:rhomboid protease GluP